MEWLTELWLPILASGVAVFFAGFLAWMVVGHHKSDWKGLGDEAAARDAIRGTAPGQYVVPNCGEDWKSDEARKKYDQGPVVYMTVLPDGLPKMGGRMLATLVMNLVVAVFCAYLASFSLPAGAPFLDVFRFVGTAAVMAYVFGGMQNAIWFGKPRAAIVKDVLDAVAYGLVTGAVFAALWPGV